METYHFKNINYTYRGYEKKALEEVSFSVEAGDFIVVCGASGSGKSTLLKCLKEANPDFGFVMQEPSTQIVTDKVYHELAFGMENQGVLPEKMKHAIAETATYFGMEGWLEKDTCFLSGGEKQILNLASVLVMAPDVILLDEPTSQLDPMAAVTFIDLLKRLNTQLGLTVILVEQRLEEVLSVCDRMLVLHEGRVAAYGSVQEVYSGICESGLSEEYLSYMPSYVRLYHRLSPDKSGCPRSVKECRKWFLEKKPECRRKDIEQENVRTKSPHEENKSCTVSCKNVFFRYEKKGRDILKDVSYEAYAGNIYGIVGGNGSGKSTFLKILVQAERCYHGKADCTQKIAYLPQEPKYMFIGDRICDIIKSDEAVQKFGLTEILNRHPYDVSGGQMQRAAMAYLYEMDAGIYLFDEPTKGMDPYWKKRFADWLLELSRAGKTVILVSHDVEFAANACEYISMCFHGELSEPVRTEKFFRDHHFYTTAVHRIVRDRYPELVSERFLYEK
ncbi:MAG: ATP-binding cassette domain-containing protein [Roseburia sp.]|nr:ATP-binding cassette domain-containing protein [Roseburia sp.]